MCCKGGKQLSPALAILVALSLPDNIVSCFLTLKCGNRLCLYQNPKTKVEI